MYLSIGEKVNWRGGWGEHLPLEATVTGIVNNQPNANGVETDSVPWSLLKGRDYIVDLDNGHWAYAFQISQAGG